MSTDIIRNGTFSKLFIYYLMTLPKDVFMLIVQMVFAHDILPIKLFVNTPIHFALLFLAERSTLANLMGIPLNILFIKPHLDYQKLHNIVSNGTIKSSDYEYAKTLNIRLTRDKKISLNFLSCAIIMVTGVTQTIILSSIAMIIALQDTTFPPYLVYVLSIILGTLAWATLPLYYQLTQDCDIDAYLYRKKYDLIYWFSKS